MKYKFNLIQSTSLVVGNVVGAGILMMPASLAAYGSFGIFGWMITSIGAILLGLVFANLSHRFVKTGGPYTFIREVFGRFAGFQTAWIYWLANTISNIAVALAFVSYMANVYPEIEQSSLYGFLLSLGCIWSLMLINCLGMAIFARIQLLITLAKIIPLIFIGGVGIFYVDWGNIYPFHITSGQSVTDVLLATTSLSIFSFIGIESATIPAENTQNPKKIIATATILGTSVAAFIYIWIQIVIMGILGAEKLALSSAPFAHAAGHIFGSKVGTIIALIAAFASFSTLNGWMLLQGQIPMAAARDGLLPKILGRVSKKGAPVFALLTSTLLMSLLVFMNYQSSLAKQCSLIISLTSFSILLPYFGCALAELKLLFKQHNSYKSRAFIVPFFVTLGALIYTIFAIIGVGKDSMLLGLILIAFGMPLYGYMRHADKRSRP